MKLYFGSFTLPLIYLNKFKCLNKENYTVPATDKLIAGYLRFRNGFFKRSEKFLKKLAELEQKSENHYVVGSLLVEAAYYTNKQNNFDSEIMKNYLNLAQKNYWSW